MTKTVKGMHNEALEHALARGPHLVTIGEGHVVAAYSLDKDELDRLFTEHGYNTDHRSWRNVIAKWGNENLWGDIVPKAKVLNDDTSTGWSVIFCTMAYSDHQRLCRFANENKVEAVPSHIDDSIPRLEACRPVSA